MQAAAYPHYLQQGYPVQGYPVQGYPVQGYPTQLPMEYKPSGPNDAPPSYYSPEAAGQPSTQSQGSNVVVVQQPAPAVISTSVRPAGDHYMTLSIVMTLICGLCFSWYGLFCTVPAMIFATNASEAAFRGDYAQARRYEQLALGLNVGAIIAYIFVWTVVIVSLAATFGAISSEYRYYYYRYTCSYSYYDTYYNYYNYYYYYCYYK